LQARCIAHGVLGARRVYRRRRPWDVPALPPAAPTSTAHPPRVTAAAGRHG
jgi:hypothetical protein